MDATIADRAIIRLTAFLGIFFAIALAELVALRR